MPYFVLCWLLSVALASPLEFHGSQTSQTVLDTGNVNLTAAGEAFIGWHDPRMNGGRFLDVSNDPQKDNEELTRGNGASTRTRSTASR
jgi:hypothetical protein